MSTRTLRIFGATAALLGLQLLAPALRGPVEGTPLEAVVTSLGVAEAHAQAWGMSRRTARRTSRRVTRRHSYGLPYYNPVYVGGTRYYTVDDMYYEPQMVEGEVVYVEVAVPR